MKTNRDVLTKGCGCADDQSQHRYMYKGESNSPTVSIDSLMMSCTIDVLEGRKFITVDIPGAFMKADMDELVHFKFE